MNIQSLSIVVPTGECWNKCPYCVSRQHCETYGKSMVTLTTKILPEQYLNRIKFVREEGCNTMMITGTAEPQQNLPFIYALLEANKKLPKPFYNIAIQTTGAGMTESDIRKLAEAGVTTLALSLSSINSERHWQLTNTPAKLRTCSIESLIKAAKDNHMNVRACFNLTDEYNYITPNFYFKWCHELDVDQATFRKIYADGETPQAHWCREHKFNSHAWDEIRSYIRTAGKQIAVLPYGFVQYSVNGISTVIDDDCMSKENIYENKYAILRPNGHLYSRWDDTGSLIF